MTITRFKAICLIACFAMLGGLAVAQLPAPTSVPDGQKMKLNGIIVSRDEEKFIFVTQDKSATYVVHLLPETDVSTYQVGVFRGNKDYAKTYLLRGLNCQVEGRGNADGAIEASDVRFKEVDLRNAQSLNLLLTPVEKVVASNTERIGANEANDAKQQGQIEENAALTSKAQATADQGLSAAEKAQMTADRANDRINGLDDYELIKAINVPFATGKYSLSPEAKKIIDDGAAWVKTQNTNGWMLSVVGFADSTGKSTSNRTLSQNRADAVINYIEEMYHMPLTKLIQPFGAGINDPVASNDTAEGRALNRRVEIRLLLNKGIAGK
jgi:outer membrane protein OmpA-like peptidoglycan-associated protein